MADKNVATTKGGASAAGNESQATTETTATATGAAAGAASAFSTLDDILSTSKSRRAGGAKIRSNVGYTLVAENFKNLSGKAVPEQEQIVLKIIKGALESPDAVMVDGRPVVPEPVLQKLIMAAHAAGQLKTKQEPFHIFRYYRTNLMKSPKDGGFAVLREVALPIAA